MSVLEKKYWAWFGDGEDQTSQSPDDQQQQSDDQKLSDDLANQKNDDGTPKFTQKQVNAMLAENKKQLRERNEKYAQELKALQGQQGLSEKVKNELESRIQQLQDEYKSQEELAKQALTKAQREHNKVLEEKTKEATHWRDLYINSTIDRELLSAAEDAYNPEHIHALLRPKTSMVEVLDDLGQPTGQYQPRVKVQIEKDGKPMVLDLSVSDAVKHLAEQPQNINLFKSHLKGGFGGGGNVPGNGGKLTTADIRSLSPEKYQQLRAEGKLDSLLGGKR